MTSDVVPSLLRRAVEAGRVAIARGEQGVPVDTVLERLKKREDRLRAEAVDASDKPSQIARR